MVKNASSKKAFRQTTRPLDWWRNCSRNRLGEKKDLLPLALAAGLAHCSRPKALAIALLSLLLLICASTAYTAQVTALLVGGL